MRFQGKPDNILPLTNSKMPMLKVNIKIEDNIFFYLLKILKLQLQFHKRWQGKLEL